MPGLRMPRGSNAVRTPRESRSIAARGQHRPGPSGKRLANAHTVERLREGAEEPLGDPGSAASVGTAQRTAPRSGLPCIHAPAKGAMDSRPSIQVCAKRDGRYDRRQVAAAAGAGGA